MEGLASKCIKDFENYFPNDKNVRPDHKWFQVATVQRPHLEKWFDVEMKLGKSMEWFRDWYKRHPNREHLGHEPPTFAVRWPNQFRLAESPSLLCQ
jgi:hypothetical protein